MAFSNKFNDKIVLKGLFGMKRLGFSLFILFFLRFADACLAQVTYTKQDSIKVVTLLKEGKKKILASKNSGDTQSLMLFYGHKLIGVPYVAATLEVNKEEKLVVNLRQLDCTTFVETVFALALTTEQGSEKWADFCANLKKIRYEDGVMKGYASRNHYFLWWVESNRKQGLITTPMDDYATKKKIARNTIYRKQTININWMTTHSSSYPMLKGKPQLIREISKHEKESVGKAMMYIPRQNLGLSKQKMKWVNDGDILAICTKKKGLDTTHIGIAEWGSDGKLHLLNASQVHKKVVLETLTLQDYMKKRPSQLGVWVISPRLAK